MEKILKENTIVNGEIANLIPVSCHLHDNTLITKDGDLIQIIEIDGFKPGSENFEDKHLREYIREFLYKNIPSSNFAIYFHILNNERSVIPDSNFGSKFAENLNKAWCNHNKWGQQLVSKLYISVVIQGVRRSSFHPSNILGGLSLSLFRKRYFANIEKNLNELSNVVEHFSKSLSKFGSKILGIKNKGGVYISEPLSFLYQLIHLSEKEIEVDFYDSAEKLSDIKINYLFNQMEIENSKKEEVVSAIFTMKPFHNMSLSSCEQILNHNYKYIITESILFAPKEEAVKFFEEKKDFLEAGKDRELLEKSGIKEILAADNGRATDYCRRRVSVTLYENNLSDFDKNISAFLKLTRKFGIVAVREDFNMAQCFWSQIPGNFRFLTRGSYNASNFSSLFSFIPNSEIGSYNGSKWGDPLTLFRTLKGLPYNFTFHIKNNGNTIIVGPNGSGKSVLARFLISHATKYNPRIIYIDIERSSSQFIESLGGSSIKIDHEKTSPLQIDFLNIKNFANDYELFKEHIKSILFGQSEISQYEEEVEKLVKNLSKEHTPESAVEVLKDFSKKIDDRAVQLSINEFIEEFFANFCSCDNLEALEQSDILEINLSQCIKKSRLFYNFMGALLCKISDKLDGRPTIITINRCCDIFDDKVFSLCLGNWLQKLTDNNALAIFSTEYDAHVHKGGVLQNNIEKFATQIFLSDKFANKNLKSTFKLSESELYEIKRYKRERNIFLLKQNGKSVTAHGSFSALGETFEGIK